MGQERSGLIVLHGIMESARSHMELARELSDTFTVYLPERRGRGRSGPYGEGHGMEKELEDLDALLAHTGARYLFGVSLGGLIALHAALALPYIRKCAVFDPPMAINGSVSNGWLARFEQELARGNVAAALVTSMLGAKLGPPFLERMPRRLLEYLTVKMLEREERKAAPGDITFRALAPTLLHDGRLVTEMGDGLEKFGKVRPDMLLLGGSRSPAYMKTALDALEKALPRVRRVEFQGLGHETAGNRNRRGRPERVAEELRRFFQSDSVE